VDAVVKLLLAESPKIQVNLVSNQGPSALMLGARLALRCMHRLLLRNLPICMEQHRVTITARQQLKYSLPFFPPLALLGARWTNTQRILCVTVSGHVQPSAIEEPHTD
jgi:hypothetical protein